MAACRARTGALTPHRRANEIVEVEILGTGREKTSTQNDD